MQSKKRRMDWDPLELNDNSNGNSVIAANDTKMTDLQNGGKQCERGRAKNVNDGEYGFFFNFVLTFKKNTNKPKASFAIEARQKQV